MVRRDELDLAEWSEKQLDQALFSRDRGLARQCGWSLNYHVLRSKGSQAGFPDRVLARDRLLFVETKSQTGKPSEEQQRWLTGLAKAGAEVYLVRPLDLKEIGIVLGKRWLWTAGSLTRPELVAWQPACLWLPTGHRKDKA